MHARSLAVLALAGSAISFAACDSPGHLAAGGGKGGTTPVTGGRGGADSTGAAGGSVGATGGSTGATGGSTQGPGGAGGNGPSCMPDPSGPTTSSSRLRVAMPWVLALGGNGGRAEMATGAGGVAGTNGGGGATSGCSPGSIAGASCNGLAQVSMGASGPRLTFTDGSVLSWDTSQAQTAVASPALQVGASVWVDYADIFTIVCPVCGARENIDVAIRSTAGGHPIWLLREGHVQADIDQALSNELFGVSFTQQAACTFSYQADCWDVTRTTFDHVLGTSPPQTLKHGQRTQLVTPKGIYDIVWASSSEMKTRSNNCEDGGDASADTAFAASRISAPE